jgi:hypothetical protein
MAKKSKKDLRGSKNLKGLRHFFSFLALAI